MIPVTHVGSLPRSPGVLDRLWTLEEGRSAPDLEGALDEAVGEVVRRQRAAGVMLPSDGEVGKISYVTYVKDRYDGFAGDSPPIPHADLD